MVISCIISLGRCVYETHILFPCSCARVSLSVCVHQVITTSCWLFFIWPDHLSRVQHSPLTALEWSRRRWWAPQQAQEHFWQTLTHTHTHSLTVTCLSSLVKEIPQRWKKPIVYFFHPLTSTSRKVCPLSVFCRSIDICVWQCLFLKPFILWSLKVSPADANAV